MSREQRKSEALLIIRDLGLPKAQQNDRSALCLLALGDVRPNRYWNQCASPLMGITPIMDWARKHYQAVYAPNTRETFRRQSMHQFVEAGVCRYNPDKPDRAVNSPGAVYQLTPEVVAVIRAFGTKEYQKVLRRHVEQAGTLAKKYASVREMSMVPVHLDPGREIRLSSGSHSELIKSIVEEFCPRFAPGAELVYVGDTGDKHGFFDVELLASLGVVLDNHGKLPDVVVYDRTRNWLLLVESVTSHGPVDPKRRGELSALFGTSSAGLVFVSAFPDRKTFMQFFADVAWETEVWVADHPTHMVHFNGSRFLGPYGK